MEQISKLEEALYNIQFEQHWLEAQTDRQAIGNSLSIRDLFGFLFCFVCGRLIWFYLSFFLLL